ncbi:uncharacterized protein LOC108206616 [Daucus carota subsp. sativus]|uniref:uncharacterized protein LOC108206616 n=1 Tax=Daucus carota subsp. sativus TaxID=79200 RepID=UPI0007EFA427|nr:PREDICTED: uncharacterized protein LOC108206616 isoform X1 [Daucus carota subsp. sativus]XP_017232463.1 PREDICTED: uncharacterized protein LOC108206616 isoform X1 [Daucus carota subsp. sativus]
MEFCENLNDMKYMILGKERGAEEMLHLCIYNHMKRSGLHEVAETFAKEANIEMADLVHDERMLTDWWGIFWPQFGSRMAMQPGENPESSAQPSVKEALEILSSLNRTNVGIARAPPNGNPSQHVNNVMGQSPEGWFQTPPEDSQRRAGKHPMNTDTTSILGRSAAGEMGMGALMFPPVHFLPTEMTSGLHINKYSHLHMPGTIQPPLPQGFEAFRSIQLEPTYPAGQDWAYLPAATIAGYSDSCHAISGCMNTGTTSILGHSAAREKGKGILRYTPVQLLPAEMTPGLHINKSSHLHMPGTIQPPPPQGFGDFRSVQLEPTYPAGQDWAYLPAATIAGYSDSCHAISGCMNTGTTSILGHSAAREKGKGILRYTPVQFLPAEMTPGLHINKSSHLHMPGTPQLPPPQGFGAIWSVQHEPSYHAGQDSAYIPAATITGENNWENQGSLTGVGVNASDGPHPDSFISHVPAAVPELMLQEAEERQRPSKRQRRPKPSRGKP